MNTKKLPNIGMERFKEYPEYIDYMDNDIAVISNISNMLTSDEEIVKIDCFLMAFCTEGNVTTSINGQQYILRKDYCAILPPGTIVRKNNTDQQYTFKIAVASSSFLSDVLSQSKETWNIIHYLYNNPIHPVKSNGSYKMYLYKELLIKLIQEEPHAYSKQTRRYHFAGMFCEMMAALNKLIPDHERSEMNPNRSTFIVRDFLELVNADDGSHRSVAYYADKLCYSPKHVSAIIKQTTGKTPLQIIHEHAIKQIKYKLKHSNMSMKEMADYFNFANPSFFGKFVKIHTGMSPMQYRMIEEEKEYPSHITTSFE